MDRNNTVPYGDGLMGVSAQGLRETRMELSLKVRDLYGSIQDVFIVPPSDGGAIQTYLIDPSWSRTFRKSPSIMILMSMSAWKKPPTPVFLTFDSQKRALNEREL